MSTKFRSKERPDQASLPIVHPRAAATTVVGCNEEDERLPLDILDTVDIVRDPVHGDIELSALERHVIDQPEFQRLRNINQLALTYISYPGALHNRYLHSLGTLFVASELIRACNKSHNVSLCDTYCN